eukprot:7457996-Alexandrium_andersonii.AAC.1
MSASLVGSEMCIRDRANGPSSRTFLISRLPRTSPGCLAAASAGLLHAACLLYTSDAADDM